MSRNHLRVRLPSELSVPTNSIRVNITTTGATAPNANSQAAPPPHLEEQRGGRDLKAKWRSFVRFFALTIREYYRQPPGASHRQRQRRRADAFTGYDYSDDNEIYHASWLRACPVYNSEVGDDEMVLSKAAEARQDGQRLSVVEVQPTVTSEDYYENQVEEVETESQTVPPIPDEDAPHYDVVFPGTPAIPEEVAASPTTRTATSSRRRPHTAGDRSSSSFGPQSPTYADGASMERHTSTPLAFTSRPPFLGRSNRSNSTATINGRQISEPLTWTLVRSQYSYPKRGLSEQQLRFLSSVESLGRYGVPSAVSTPVATTPDTESPGYFSPQLEHSL